MRAHLLWDLDGTLTDPRVGITTCIQYALNKAGHRAPDAQELLWCIGPPLVDSFEKLVPGASPRELLGLVDLYRERFAQVGMFENMVYPGIAELLKSLQGRSMFVATSKPHVFARSILEHFGLQGHFIGIHGSELDGKNSDKGELIAHVLDHEGLRPQEALMIGDRLHDVLGARKNGLLSVGACWGYGSEHELRQAGADYLCMTPAELGRLIG